MPVAGCFQLSDFFLFYVYTDVFDLKWLEVGKYSHIHCYFTAVKIFSQPNDDFTIPCGEMKWRQSGFVYCHLLLLGIQY